MNSLGLDIGSTEFRSIRYENGRLVGRKIPAYYCVLTDEPTNRRLLKQAQISFAVAKESLIIIGEAALELSTLIQCPMIPVMYEGAIPWNDPVGRQVCVHLIESLVPYTESHQARCTFSSSTLHKKLRKESPEFLEKILQLRGYQVSRLDSATAVILSEFQDHDFSGMSIVIGAESISVSVTHLGTPVFKDVYGQGFRSVEQKFSIKRHRYHWDSQGNQYLNLNSIRTWLKTSQLSLEDPQSGDELWIAEQCESLVKKALSSMLTDLIKASRQGQFRNRLPVVVSGGATNLNGFQAIVEDVLKSSGVPIRTQEVSSSINGAYTVARGLLVNSMLETETILNQQNNAA